MESWDTSESGSRPKPTMPEPLFRLPTFIEPQPNPSGTFSFSPDDDVKVNLSVAYTPMVIVPSPYVYW
uniref:Uncharacterized protein n=1 Tax=Arundo donax TaxID=35708 RepID=A0A0A9CJ28_ARUDO